MIESVEPADLRRYRAVAVSPHFDDVALSLAGLLLRTEGPTAIVTVHGAPPPDGVAASSWDEDCGFASAAAAYETRLGEDARACAVLGADQITLPNADGPYRRDEPLAGLNELLRALPADVELYLPAGVNQPDHRRIREQAIAALDTGRRVRPQFYADLPYSAAEPGWADVNDDPDAWPADVRDLDRRYRAGLEVAQCNSIDGALWDAKRRAVLCHASQLSLVASMGEIASSRPLLGVHGLLTVEVVWRPRDA